MILWIWNTTARLPRISAAVCRRFSLTRFCCGRHFLAYYCSPVFDVERVPFKYYLIWSVSMREFLTNWHYACAKLHTATSIRHECQLDSSADKKKMLDIAIAHLTNLCAPFLWASIFSSVPGHRSIRCAAHNLLVCTTNTEYFSNAFQTHNSVRNAPFIFHRRFFASVSCRRHHSPTSHIFLFKFPKLPRRGPNAKLNLFISLTSAALFVCLLLIRSYSRCIIWLTT